ncbi:MAG: chemotaxis protein CheW [Gammaproteobacteria bacterium]|nr:chemotaxis protein CheW [Gammaproteobacteria bacterium]
MDDLLNEFLTETAENMDVLDVELVKLEQNPNDPELLGNIFRLVHTVKGTCGFLGLPRLEGVAHAAESLFARFRDGELEVTPKAVSLVLESLDRIKALLRELEKSGSEPEGDDQDLISQLESFAEDAVMEAMMSNETVQEPGEDSDELQAAFDAAQYRTASRDAHESEVELPQEPEAEAEEGASAGQVPSVVRQTGLSDSGDDGVAGSGAGGVASQSIRVSVDLLENLMTMVSELVLTRNQLLQILRAREDSEFSSPLQRLSHVTTELQESVMKTRMQPIGNAWAKLPRIVRDLSLELSKKVNLQMIGAETELDRQVLELIRDPLTHMVRNSCDHGVELPSERRAAGKPETGTITLNAFHEGGHIIIDVSDDGKGLSVDKIKAKAMALGLATESELEVMSDEAVQQFIMRPGFSTASNVTAVSGRGVGMDVVRTNIEKIGGTIELKSLQGRGTTFVIKIPLTLAIVSALIVEAGGERFAVPQISVVELVRTGRGSEHKIEDIHHTPVLRLRNRLLPLTSLRAQLKLGSDEFGEADDRFIIVTKVGNFSFGIIVDKVFDTEEIVVKPVSSLLRNITLFSGNTILGDGSVIMILDPNGIASDIGEITVTEAATAEMIAATDGEADDRVPLLLFHAGDDTPMAVPLALVARLEEIALDDVEISNGQLVVQYRGGLMPLLPLRADGEIAKSGRQSAIVFADRDRSMGLLVDEIVDIVEDRLSIELTTERPGMLGSAIIDGEATDIVDTSYYLTQAYGDWFVPHGGDTTTVEQSRRKRRVLLIDDSAFFRNLLSPLLSVAGYAVTTVETADRAMELYEDGRDFDVILSDIELPGMNGFEFAQAVRSSERWAAVPLIALSAYTSIDHLQRGHDVGFDDYVGKFDRDTLLRTLETMLYPELAELDDG